MDVCEAGRIRNNGFSNKRAPRNRVWLDTRPPAPLEHLSNHLALLLDIACAQALYARDQTRVLDHIGHQFGRVAADRVELEAGLAYEVSEGIVRRKAYAVAVALELGAEGDEGLDVAAATDDLDDNIQADAPGTTRGVLWRYALPFALVLRRVAGDEEGECSAECGVEVDVNASIVCGTCEQV